MKVKTAIKRWLDIDRLEDQVNLIEMEIDDIRNSQLGDTDDIVIDRFDRMANEARDYGPN
jgi:hypothetical protein